MIIVKFHGKSTIDFWLDASSIIEAQFMVQEYINTQMYTPEYDTVILLPYCGKNLASHFEITLRNFDFYEPEEYLKSRLLRLG